jgi:hypothetical protein
MMAARRTIAIELLHEGLPIKTREEYASASQQRKDFSHTDVVAAN